MIARAMPTPRDTTPTRPGHDSDTTRLSVLDAAQILGITPDAVRARIRRGTMPSERIDGHLYVFLPTADLPDTTPTERQHDTDTTRHDSDQSILIAHMEGEIAYLRSELAKRSDELARERERGDVLQREALARIEALTAGNTPTDAPAPPGATFAPGAHAEPTTIDLDDFAFENDLVVPGEIHKQWADLTDELIAELGMDPEAALVAAAQELGIDFGGSH